MYKHITFSRVLTAVAVGLLGMACDISCSRSEVSTTPRPVAEETDARHGAEARQPGRRIDEHWVQDAKVRALMQQIARGTASWPSDLPEDPESPQPKDLERAFADAAILANALAGAASQLPDAVAGRPMTGDAREGFREQAESLRRQALQLKEAAAARRVEQMQRTLNQIITTCFACHSRYRDITGELNRANRDPAPLERPLALRLLD